MGASHPLSQILLFYFDLANEAYGTVVLPNGHDNAQACSLTFISGKITFIECRGDCETSSSCYSYELWLMDEFGKKETGRELYKLE